MGTGLKVFLWVVGIIALLIGLLVGAGVYIGYKGLEGLEEASTFAETATKTECMEESARRTSECKGGACVSSEFLFGLRCLRIADGPYDNLCEKNRPSKQLGSNFCANYDNNKNCAEVSRQVLTEFCRDPDAPPMLPLDFER